MGNQSETVLLDALEQRFRWETNEAQMVVDVLLPTLQRMFAGPDVEIRVECHLHLRLGTNLYRVDSTPKTAATGRADFFVVDRTTGQVIVVVEAKRPGHVLTQDDRDQLGSYMGTVRPVAPFGILSNGRNTEVLVWRDGITVDASAFPELESVVPSFNALLHDEYARRLLAASPEYRDQVSTQIAEAKLKPVALASLHPREAVAAVQARISATLRSVTIVTSPPQCGKTQVLVDLFERRTGPAIFVDDEPPSSTIQHFDPSSSRARDVFVAYLEARRSSAPVLILVEAHRVDSGLMQLLDYVANDDTARCHVVIAANPATTRSLLMRRDDSLLFGPDTPVAVLELGAFTDDELVHLYPEGDIDLLSQPFLRLFRWPGMQRVVRDRAFSDLGVGDALANWFMQANVDTQQAIAALGAFLAQHPSSMRQRLPAEFVRGQSLHLAQLEQHGFVCQIPNPRTGIAGYALTCIEIAAYALLAHVFQSDSPDAPLLDEIVRRLRDGDSDAEVTALVALLPHFLTDPNPTSTRGKIVRRMLGISFDTHRLEGLTRAKVLDSFAGVRIAASDGMLDSPRELVESALLVLRRHTGHMPNFRELEQQLGPTLRQDAQRRQHIYEMRLSSEELGNSATLARLARAQRLDMLWMLAEGDHEWLGTGTKLTEVVGVAETIVVSLADERRLGFPIESVIPELAGCITRNQARDLRILLRRRAHQKAVLEDSAHVRLLIERVIESHAQGDSEALADCFHYVEAMRPELLEALLGAAISEGTPAQFVYVLLNGLWPRIRELNKDAQTRVVYHLVQITTGHPGLLEWLDTDMLRWLARDFVESFAALRRVEVSALAQLRMLLQVEPRALGELSDVVESMSTSEVAQIWQLPNFVRLLSSRAEVDAWVDGLRADAPARLVSSLIELDGSPLGTFVTPSADIAHARLRELIASAPSFPVGPGRRLHWSRSRVRVLVQACIPAGLDHALIIKLDRLLRAALLRVHDSSLNRYAMGELVTSMAATPLAHTALLRRLILSGFDLWEIKLDDEADCPMLHTLLAKLRDEAGSAATDLFRVAARWLTQHWCRVRQLPNLSSYSIRHLMGIKGFVEHTVEAIGTQADADSLSIDAIVLLSDMLPWFSKRENRDLVREFAQEVLNDYPELEGPLEQQHPHAWEQLRAAHDATEVETLELEDLLRDIGDAIEVVPQLPVVLSELKPTTHHRSMLTPLESGFVYWSPEAFLASWRDP